MPERTGSLPGCTSIMPGFTGIMLAYTGSLPGCAGIMPEFTGNLPVYTGFMPECTRMIPVCTGSLPGCTGMANVKAESVFFDALSTQIPLCNEAYVILLLLIEAEKGEIPIRVLKIIVG